jgi:sec-independent protein translocase protein TatA
MLGKIGLPEILIVLVIVLLVFGVGRISKVSGELGKSIRVFRDNLAGTNKDEEIKDK